MMHNLLCAILSLSILASCNSNQNSSEIKQVESKQNDDSIKNTELVEILQGLWLSDSYLQNIEKNKSIFLSKDYNTKLLGFKLDKNTLLTDSPLLEGFTTHEGGYTRPIKYDVQKNEFENDLTRITTYDYFPDPFELILDGNCKLAMYFPKTQHSDIYRKVNADLQTAIRQLLIAGTYYAPDGQSEVKFDENGEVHNFKNFKYYELVADFVEGIEFDAIVFYYTLAGGNWVDGEVYKFEIISNSLHLQHVQTNWETMEHEVSNEILILEHI